MTHLLPTAVKEREGVYPILDSGANDRDPMENDRGMALVSRQELEYNRSNESEKTSTRSALQVE